MNEAPVRINYKHLGTSSRSRAKARSPLQPVGCVAPQTVSAQLLTLESSLGRPLFDRVGRRLVLTTDGEVALDYAESIFGLGLELRSVLSGRADRSIAFRVGIADRVPKAARGAGARAGPVAPPGRARTHPARRATRTICSAGSRPTGSTRCSPTSRRRRTWPAMRARKLAESGVIFMASPALAWRPAGGSRTAAGARLISGPPAHSPTGSAIDALFGRTRRRVWWSPAATTAR